VWHSSPLTHAFVARRPTPSHLQRLAAVVTSNYIWTSTDTGVTWTDRTSSGAREWWKITSSSDGTVRQVVRMRQSKLLSPRHACRGCQEVVGMCGVRHLSLTPSCSTADPIAPTQKLAAVDIGPTDQSGGYIVTSPDSGVTWTERIDAGKRPWYAITSSSDGMVRQVSRLGRDSHCCHPCVPAVYVERWWVCMAFVASPSRLLARRLTPFNLYSSSPPRLNEVTSIHRRTRV